MTSEMKNAGNKPPVHLVCNAHMDPVWLWNWPEGLGAAISTFRVAAQFCEETENFIFAHNESLLYEWVEEHDHALFERIRKLVKAGKWKIMGGWYLQPDCNMPAGESIVRQILTGNRYFKEKFGETCEVAVSMDCFGHAKGLVQILEQAGYTGYLYMRPDFALGLLDIPQRVCWEGYNGSRVKAYRLNTGYNTLKGQAADVIEGYIRDTYDGTCDILRMWGIGDHGGGPSRIDLQNVNALIERERENVPIIHSCPDDFMATMDMDALPVFDRDLNAIDAGCYTSMKQVKRLHRALEGKLLSSEKLASLCEMAGIATYPKAELDSAWKELLFCEFHDILPGTCIKPSENDAIQKLNYGLEICDKLQVKLFYALANHEVAPQQGDIPVMVLNPHPYPVTGVFTCEFMLEDQNWADTFFSATVYQNGEALPSQMEKEACGFNLDWRKNVCFKATLRPMSLNRFDCKLTELPRRPFYVEAMTEANKTLVCGDMEYTFDLTDGSLCSIRKSGVEQITPGFGRLHVYNDDCDPWLVNRIEITDFNSQFTLLSAEEAGAYAACDTPVIPAIRIVEDGDVRYRVEVLLGWHSSRARVLYSFPKDGSEMEISYTVHWNEKDTMLRANLTHSFTGAVYTGQDMYGTKALTTTHEMVAQKWMVAEDAAADRAMAVINDSTYGFKLGDNTIECGILRSPTYSCHQIKGGRMPFDRYYARMEQGENIDNYVILFGTKAEIARRTDIRAQVMNEKPLAVSFFPDGQGDTLRETVTVSGVRLDALKKSEDGQGYILRLFNFHDHPQTGGVEVALCHAQYTAEFGPMEIKTLRLDSQGLREVHLINEI